MGETSPSLVDAEGSSAFISASWSLSTLVFGFSSYSKSTNCFDQHALPTRSISSAAALFFSLALTLAVVDRTAVATLATASFFGGFVGVGYANKLGLAFET
jgi:hypothetical protein